MPALTAENKAALSFYGDVKSFGWDAATELNASALTDHGRGDLLLRLRTIAGEVAALEREKMQAASAKGGR